MLASMAEIKISIWLLTIALFFIFKKLNNFDRVLMIVIKTRLKLFSLVRILVWTRF